MTCGVVIAGVCKAARIVMRSASALAARCGGQGGAPGSRIGRSVAKGASASAVTTQGETEVCRLLPRKGPSGGIS